MNKIKERIFWVIPKSTFALLERIRKGFQNHTRLRKLSNSPAKDLNIGHVNSLELLEIIKQDIQNPVIFDIGAHIGTWSRLALSIFPNVKIYAFEPIKSNFKKLTENLKHFSSCELFNIAVGAANHKSLINVTNITDASSILALEEYTINKYDLSISNNEEIEIFSLDWFILQNNITRPNVLKLDIQGFELEALKGASQIIETVEFIICEVSFISLYKEQALFSDIVSFLNKNNFEVNAFGLETPLGTKLEQTDVLFKKMKK